MQLSLSQVRRLFLKQQGLLGGSAFGKGKRGALGAVQRLGYAQIDTISVVLRAHNHVLASRVPGFQPAMLQALHDERALYEHWAHAAAYLPFTSFRYSLPLMRGFAATREYDRKLGKEIIARIRTEGPLQSRDFEDTRTVKGGWWQRKPAKLALDYMFLGGELMVSHRDGFQKALDLPENVIPPGTDTRMPSIADWCRHQALTMARALGVASAKDLGYALPNLRRLSGLELQAPFKAALAELCEAGELVQVKAEGETWYSTPDTLAALPLRAPRGPVKPLSPFDNLVINRSRLRRIFGFDYQLECYVPEAKRRYGYFALPLLWGDTLIGRLDAKAERPTRLLAVKRLILEPSTEPSAALLDALATGLAQFAAANNCDNAKVQATTPAHLKSPLNKQLKAFILKSLPRS